MTPEDAITQEVRALERLDLEGLRADWRRRYGAPPRLRSTDLLARLLAWRIQAEAFGGLDAETRSTLFRKSLPVVGPRLALACAWSGHGAGRRRRSRWSKMAFDGRGGATAASRKSLRLSPA